MLKDLAAGLLFPDRHLLWMPTALSSLAQAVRRWRPQAVLVNAPPFPSFLLGWAAARLGGAPLLLGFRDEWNGFYARSFRPDGQGRLWGAAVPALESALLRSAAMVICAPAPIMPRASRASMTGRATSMWGSPPKWATTPRASLSARPRYA